MALCHIWVILLGETMESLFNFSLACTSIDSQCSVVVLLSVKLADRKEAAT